MRAYLLYTAYQPGSVLLLPPSLFPLPDFHGCLVVKACVFLMPALALLLAFAARVGIYCCWVPPPAPPTTNSSSCCSEMRVPGEGKRSVWESRLLASLWLVHTRWITGRMGDLTRQGNCWCLRRPAVLEELVGVEWSWRPWGMVGGWGASHGERCF